MASNRRLLTKTHRGRGSGPRLSRLLVGTRNKSGNGKLPPLLKRALRD